MRESQALRPFVSLLSDSGAFVFGITKLEAIIAAANNGAWPAKDL